MKIKLALAAQNTEKCFEAKTFGTDDGIRAAKLVELSVGDVIVFYKAKEGFAGIWKVVKPYYRDTSKIWDDGVYPNRVKIEPVIALKPSQYVDARTMVDDLKMVTHPLYYGLAFRQNLADIPPEDYELIKSRLEQAAKK
jgi:predicted RNA-binding protein